MHTKALPEVRAAVTLWLLEAQQQVFQRVHEVQTQVTVLQQHLRKQAQCVNVCMCAFIMYSNELTHDPMEVSVLMALNATTS